MNLQLKKRLDKFQSLFMLSISFQTKFYGAKHRLGGQLKHHKQTKI